MQRNCRCGQRRALQEIFAIVFFFFVVDIPYFDSHLHWTLLRCECARGGAAAGWIEKVSECRETAGVGRGARCSFSDRAAGGVSAGRRGEA